MSIHRTRSTHRTHLTIARRAALLAVGTATAVGLTGALTGTASALTPQPDLPVVIVQPEIDPPVDPTPPLPAGPDDLAIPPIVPDPFPVPPELPGDLTLGETDPEVPDPQPEPEPEPDGGGIPEGPGDLTAVPDPTHPDDPAPDPTVPDTTVPEPEVADEVEESAAPDAELDSLAFTGGDLGLVTAGGALLVAGALAAGAATVARRRQGADSAELG
jgi:hypothetical protein